LVILLNVSKPPQNDHNLRALNGLGTGGNGSGTGQPVPEPSVIPVHPFRPPSLRGGRGERVTGPRRKERILKSQEVSTAVLAWLIRADRVGVALTGSAAGGARCPACGTLTVTGLDGDRCGLPVRLDGRALTPLGELGVIWHGGMSWRLSVAGGRAEISVRQSWDIAATLADRGHPVRLGTVHAEHSCGHVWAKGWTYRDPPAAIVAPIDYDGEIPY